MTRDQHAAQADTHCGHVDRPCGCPNSPSPEQADRVLAAASHIARGIALDAAAAACRTLAAEMDLDRHEYTSDGTAYPRCALRLAFNRRCDRGPGDRIHRTSALVLAEHPEVTAYVPYTALFERLGQYLAWVQHGDGVRVLADLRAQLRQHDARAEPANSWPGACQTCGAPLSPPNATYCPVCDRSDHDDD